MDHAVEANGLSVVFATDCALCKLYTLADWELSHYSSNTVRHVKMFPNRSLAMDIGVQNSWASIKWYIHCSDGRVHKTPMRKH